MKKTFAVLGLAAALSIQASWALISVPVDFPTDGVNGSKASDKEQLALLVSRYQNDIVLLVNPTDAYSKEILNTKAAPATMERLQALGTSNGKLSVDSLASAVTVLVRQNPSQAPVIVASALAMLDKLPGGRNAENRAKIARAAIAGLPEDLKEEARIIALITGVAAQGLSQTAATLLVKNLRDFAISNEPGNQQSAFALAVDQALVNEGILSPYAGSPEFLVMADNYNFAGAELGETFFSGDQGAINQGAVFSPGSAGSAGGAGNVGNQNQDAEPTPTPPPPAS